jgi:hypothetical protein
VVTDHLVVVLVVYDCGSAINKEHWLPSGVAAAPDIDCGRSDKRIGVGRWETVECV